MPYNSNEIEVPLIGLRPDRLPRTIADRTRRVYDRLAFLYPLSTRFFHQKAHRTAIGMSGIENGMRILEAATGSGEMFRRLVNANPDGETLGFDLSPNMAARTYRDIRRQFPAASTMCKAVDARYLPFRNGTFDAIVCCYLLELLAAEDISRVMREFHRVLRPGMKLTLVMIGENKPLFNQAYLLAGSVAPAFWGRQVEKRAPEILEAAGFRLEKERVVRQGFYPSRVVVASR